MAPSDLLEFLHRLGVANPYGRGWLTVLLVFFLALLFTWRFLPHVRRFALKVGWADLPNERRLNREPLPNAGGLALYAGVVLALVVAAFLRPILVEQVLIQVLAILLGGAWLVLVGFIDDQFGLPPLFRLFVQTLSALLLVAVGVRFEAAFGTPLDPALGLFLTWLWVVGITNALNLMDGLDGLAGGIAFISAMSLLFVSAQFPYWAAGTLVLSALAGASLGFLRHNLHPSRIILTRGPNSWATPWPPPPSSATSSSPPSWASSPRRSSSSSPSWTPPRWWCGGSSGGRTPSPPPARTTSTTASWLGGFPKGGWPSSSGGRPSSSTSSPWSTWECPGRPS